MDCCKECSNSASWKCISCNVVLCPGHKRSHNDDDEEHSFVKLKFSINSGLKSQILKEINLSITTITEASSEIIESTCQIIFHIQNLSKIALEKLEIRKAKYLRILTWLEKEILHDQFKEIEDLKNRKLISNKHAIDVNKLGLQAWYEQDFVIERQKFSLTTTSASQAEQILREEYGLCIEHHTSGVLGVAISRDNKHIISVSRDTTIRIWDIAQEKQESIVQGHTGAVCCIAIANDSSYFVTGSSDQSVRVWDFEKKQERAIFEGHFKIVRSVAISKDNNWVISSSDDCSVRVWSLQSKKEKYLMMESCQIWSVAITNNCESIVYGGNDSYVSIWRFKESKKAENNLSGHTGIVWAVALTSDDEYIISGSQDHTIRIWNFDSGDELSVLTGHNDHVRCLAVSLDNAFIISGSDDLSIRIWDFGTKIEKNKLINYHAAAIKGVAITTDNNLLVKILRWKS